MGLGPRNSSCIRCAVFSFITLSLSSSFPNFSTPHFAFSAQLFASDILSPNDITVLVDEISRRLPAVSASPLQRSRSLISSLVREVATDVIDRLNFAAVTEDEAPYLFGCGDGDARSGGRPDYSSECPLHWVFDFEGDKCSAPPHYSGPCGPTLEEVHQWTPQFKRELSLRCRAAWPCAPARQRQDFREDCPEYWTKDEKRKICTAPPRVVRRRGCPNTLHYAYLNNVSIKQLVSDHCGYSWPAQTPCRCENRNALAPVGWRAFGPATKPGLWLAPLSYTGPCDTLLTDVELNDCDRVRNCGFEWTCAALPAFSKTFPNKASAFLHRLSQAVGSRVGAEFSVSESSSLNQTLSAWPEVARLSDGWCRKPNEFAPDWILRCPQLATPKMSDAASASPNDAGSGQSVHYCVVNGAQDCQLTIPRELVVEFERAGISLMPLLVSACDASPECLEPLEETEEEVRAKVAGEKQERERERERTKRKGGEISALEPPDSEGPVSDVSGTVVAAVNSRMLLPEKMEPIVNEGRVNGVGGPLSFLEFSVKTKLPSAIASAIVSGRESSGFELADGESLGLSTIVGKGKRTIDAISESFRGFLGFPEGLAHFKKLYEESQFIAASLDQLSSTPGTCYRDLAAPICPLGWKPLPPVSDARIASDQPTQANTCFPAGLEVMLPAICPIRGNAINMNATPLEKLELERKCGVRYPCMTCVEDLVQAFCPQGWRLAEHTRAKSLSDDKNKVPSLTSKANGRLCDVVDVDNLYNKRCPKRLDFTYFEPETKSALGALCGVRWPCATGHCAKDYALPCPADFYELPVDAHRALQEVGKVSMCISAKYEGSCKSLWPSTLEKSGPVANNFGSLEALVDELDAFANRTIGKRLDREKLRVFAIERDPGARAAFEERCEVEWPCAGRCAPDYLARCPYGWFVDTDGGCYPSVRAGSPSALAAFGGIRTLLWAPEMKRDFERVTGAIWPCKDHCERDWREPCPWGWQSTTSEEQPGLKVCRPSPLYGGNCVNDNAELFSMTFEQKEAFSIKCGAKWRCLDSFLGILPPIFPKFSFDEITNDENADASLKGYDKESFARTGSSELLLDAMNESMDVGREGDDFRGSAVVMNAPRKNAANVLDAAIG